MHQFVTVVVEDDALQRDVLSELLKDDGLEVVVRATAEAAELVISTTGPNSLPSLTDLNLEGR